MSDKKLSEKFSLINALCLFCYIKMCQAILLQFFPELYNDYSMFYIMTFGYLDTQWTQGKFDGKHLKPLKYLVGGKMNIIITIKTYEVYYGLTQGVSRAI